MFDQYHNRERPLSQLPFWLKTGLPLAFVMQLFWHGIQPGYTVKAQPLPPPLSAQAYRLISLNEPLVVAKYLNLWLQSFDTQPGISLSYQQLDYSRVIAWLDTILALDPGSQYPMLVAAHIYGSVHNGEKQRQMTEYIYQQFLKNPQQNWRWLADAVIIARHEIKDTSLALKYASALAAQPAGSHTSIPYWAKDLKIFVLEDLDEIAAAKVLVGGLLESGEISDAYELRFLTQKIASLEKKLMKDRQDVEISTEKRYK